MTRTWTWFADVVRVTLNDITHTALLWRSSRVTLRCRQHCEPGKIDVEGGPDVNCMSCLVAEARAR